MFQKATKPSILVTHRGTGGEGSIFSSCFCVCALRVTTESHKTQTQTKPQPPGPAVQKAETFQQGMAVLGTAPALQVQDEGPRYDRGNEK